MKKMIVFGAVCLSATVLLARAEQKKGSEAPPPVKSTVKMTPMNVKTGLWQSTSSVAVSGGLGLPPETLAKLTPEQKARYEAAMQANSGGRTSTFTNKDCLTKEDLTADPFTRMGSDDENVHCHGALLSSTGTDIVLQETCSGEASLNYTMKIHAVDQEHATGTGSGTATMGGHTMSTSVKFEAKWLGATCPAHD